jgi:hypothetical protein
MNFKKKKVYPEIPVYSMECGNLVGTLIYDDRNHLSDSNSYVFGGIGLGLGPAFLRNIADMIDAANKKYGVQ